MTLDQRTAYYGGTDIQCLLCGRRFRKLGVHVLRVHEMQDDDYKRRYGLPLYKGLTSEPTARLHGIISQERGSPYHVSAEQAASAREAKVKLKRENFLERNPEGRPRGNDGRFG
jgi:hypothetical protein